MFSFIAGHISFDLISKNASIVSAWLGVVKSLVEIVSPTYGQVRSMNVKGWDAPFNLPLRLPDIPPISIYGREYIDLFGADKIESAPFSAISQVGECYWLVANESLLEEVPDTKRQEIRCYFGEDSFMADGHWKYRDGRALSFDFSNSLCLD